MESVEYIQKVNQLAQELLDHKICPSRDDAVKRAEEMLGKKPMPTHQPKVEEQKPLHSTVSDNSLEQLKQAMLKNNQFIVKTINEFRAQLSQLSDDFTMLKKEFYVLKNNAVSQQVQSRPAQTQQSAASSSDPKNGKFNSEDVKIENIFYYGNK